MHYEHHEYMHYERLDKDVQMMKAAGFNVVRLGESTWSLWKPEGRRFEYGWMDRVIDAIGKAGIKVIMGNPTDSAAYRFYAERLIRKIATRYKDNPMVIGWQVDNETGSYGAANEDVFIRFQHHLEK